MKDIEKICGSSLNHFLILDSNTTNIQPSVTFTVKTASSTTITIKDADNSEWEGIVLTGTASGVISSTSFVTKNNAISTGLSLLECLKKNGIFFDFNTPVISGNQITLTCSLEMSRSYIISSSSTSNISVSTNGGNTTITKYIVDMDVERKSSKSNLSLDKYSIDNTVSFNLTSPFSSITEKYPLICKLFSYRTDGTNTNLNTLSVNDFYVLPTTLHKFDDVDFYNDYFKDSASPLPKPILTNNINKTINYDETIALSFLTNDTSVKLQKRYYTTSGRYLTKDINYLYKEFNFIRCDFYDTPDIELIETQYNTQVGYILYNILDGSNNIISNDLKYNVVPSCNPNNIIFFVNELGGLDSFNFLANASTEYEIEEQLTYSTTPLKPFTDVKVIEQEKSKYQTITHTLKTSIINRYTSDWLNELNKSRYVYQYDNGVEIRIIPNSFTIETTHGDEEYELTFKYHRSDNKVRI